MLAGIEKKPEVEHHPGYALSRSLNVPTDAKKPYKTTFYGRKIEKDGVTHTLSRAKGIPGWLIHSSDKNGARFVRVDAEFKPVATAGYRRGDGDPQPISDAATAEFLSAERELWGSAPEKGAPAR
ncbi:MAG: hypothetical protein M0D55_10870 [Elusimicrobiota bacterium]|nr:MAG: hypothetical protein M0D55_10870 [Elusimicrobiota bacterium]